MRSVNGVPATAEWIKYRVALITTGRDDALGRVAECPWKLGAMTLVTAVVITLGFWLPAPLFELVKQSAQIIGGVR